jgi:predicted aspartyl protease
MDATNGRLASRNTEDAMDRSAGALGTRGRRRMPVAVMAALAALGTAVAAHAADAADTAPAAQATVMSLELLDGSAVGAEAQGLHVQGDLRAVDPGEEGEAVFAGLFRVDTGAEDSIAPASELDRIGIARAGRASYTRADGTSAECDFGLARVEFMGEMIESRVLFGPEDVVPAIGTAALQAIGIGVDPATRTLQRTTSEP